MHVFNELLVTYEQSIKRDPSYASYVKIIGRIWFDILPPKSNIQNGIFGNLIQTLFSGMETDDNMFEDEMPQPSVQNRLQAEDVE